MQVFFFRKHTFVGQWTNFEKKLTESDFSSSRSGIGRQSSFALNEHQQARILPNECPLRGRPRCVGPSRRYRTPDGTCNNADRPWLGAAMLPMQRFLHPVYEDGELR